MQDIFTHYCDSATKDASKKAVARFLSIYIDEAHARDEWWLWDAPYAKDGERGCIYNHKNLQDRIAAAKALQRDTNFPGKNSKS